MSTLANILFIGLLLIGVSLWGLYAYIALWRFPKEKSNKEKLGWYAMIYASTATFSLLLAWRIKEPLAHDFLLIFFVLSLVIGYLFRESMTSPHELTEFLLTIVSKRKNKNINKSKSANDDHQDDL